MSTEGKLSKIQTGTREQVTLCTTVHNTKLNFAWTGQTVIELSNVAVLNKNDKKQP